MSSPIIPNSFSYNDFPQGGSSMPMIIAGRDPSDTTDAQYAAGYTWLSSLDQGGSGNMFVQSGNSAGLPNWTAVTAGAGGTLNTLSDGTTTVLPSGGNIDLIGTANQIVVTSSAPAHQLTFTLPSSIIAPGSLTVTTSLTVTGAVILNGGVTVVGGLATDTLTSTGATTLATTGASISTFGNTTGTSGLTLSVGTNNFVQEGAATSTTWISKGQTTGTTLIGGSAQTGAITVGSSSGAVNSVLIANGSGSTTVSLANVTTAGATVNIMEGANTVANVFNLSSGAVAGDNTVNILSGNAVGGVLTFNVFGSASATTGGIVNIGTGAAAHVLNLGNATAATASQIIMLVGTGSSPDFKVDGLATSKYEIGESTTSGTITIGGSAQNTGFITLGHSSASSTVKIQSGAGASTTTIGEGTGAANVTSINSGATSQNSTINLMTGAMGGGTHAVNILTGNSSVGTETFNVCTGTGAAALNIGTGTVGIKTIAIGGTAANVITIGNTQTTGSVAIGNALTSGTVTVGGTAGTGAITIGQATNITGQTVFINSGASIAGPNVVSVLAGATPAANQTFNLMTGVGTAGTYAVNVLTGNSTGTTQSISLGTGSARTDITLGGTGANVIKINDTTTAGTVSIGNAMTSGTIQIGGSAQTGATAIIIGPSTAAGGATYQIGNATNTGAQVIDIASGSTATAASTVNILNGATPAASTSLNIMNGAASAGTQAFKLLSTGATRAGTVNIADGAAAHTVVIGSLNTTAKTTLQSGTGGISLATGATTPGLVSVTPSTDTQASPAAASTIDSRVGSVIFTGFTTASAGSQVFTITNSLVSATSAIFVCVSNLGAADAQMTLTRVKPGAGSFTVSTTNNGAAALNGNVIVNFWVIN